MKNLCDTKIKFLTKAYKNPKPLGNHRQKNSYQAYDSQPRNVKLYASGNKFSSQSSNNHSQKEHFGMITNFNKKNTKRIRRARNREFEENFRNNSKISNYGFGVDTLDDLYPEQIGSAFHDEGPVKISEKNMRNRRRLANKETQNPILSFFRLILVRFGCSEA